MSQIPYLKTDDVRDCTRRAKCSCSCSCHLNEKPKLIMDKLFLIYKLIPQS